MGESIKLTEKRILELPIPIGKKYKRYWDSVARGLCVRVTSGGKRRYLFRGRRKGDSRPIWQSGPRCSEYSLEEMRRDVNEWNVALAKGVNPFVMATETKNAPTVREVCSENLQIKETQQAPRLSERHLKDIRYYNGRLQEGELADVPIDEVTVAAAESFLGGFKPRTAEFLRYWLSNSYDLAIRRSYVPLGFNPWKYTAKKYRLPTSDELPRFTDDEIKEVAGYLRQAEREPIGDRKRKVNPVWIKFVWFLIRNGTRPSETLAIRRSWLRELNGVHYILHPRTKTGEKRIVLSEESLKDVNDVMALHKDSECLFPGKGGKEHLLNYRTEFGEMQKHLGIFKPPYAIRRWFAHLGRMVYDGDVGPIQRLVGWESEEMALRYAGNDESFMEKFVLENAEVCRAVSTKIEELAKEKVDKNPGRAEGGSGQ